MNNSILKLPTYIQNQLYKHPFLIIVGITLLIGGMAMLMVLLLLDYNARLHK